MSSPSNLLQTKNMCFEEEWPKIRPVVLKILNQESVPKDEWQDLFWVVHMLSSWGPEKSMPKLQEALLNEITDYIKMAYSRIQQHQEENALLKAYISEWHKFYAQSVYLPEPFRAFETMPVTQGGGGATSSGSTRSPAVAVKNYAAGGRPTTGTGSSTTGRLTDDSVVRRLMLETWNKIIFSNIKDRLQAAAMKLVLAERNGEAFDSQLVVGVRESYVSLCTDVVDRLQIYRQHFERPYVEATESFYRRIAPQILHENGVQMYMRYVDQKLNEEEQRGRRYLETCAGCTSVKLLLDRCVDVLVVAFQDQIFAECSTMIKLNEVEKLRLMYRLLNRTPSGLVSVLKHLEDHIRNQGLADMVANAESITSDPEKYVEQLLAMFDRFSALVRDAFCDDPRFLTARDKAFQEVVNDTTVFRLELAQTKQKGAQAKTQPESKCPELLANYCDLLLRKTPLSRKLTSDDIDSKLQEVLLVLKYVQNKDVFMRFHKAHLARRLILDVSADQEKEETMVHRLREAGMPADYINKLLRMLQDIEINKDLNKAFKSTHTLSNNNRNAIADVVNIKILNAGAWARGAERVPVSLPRELEDFIPEVEEFYRGKHSGRRLQWHHHWSNGVIMFANDEGGRYELEVTTFQMSVLFCWNDRPHDKISYENIRLATELPDMELRKTLWSLVAAPKLKHQVLLCDCDSRNPKDFTDISLFWPNQQFVIIKNGKPQKRGRLNLIGRLQLNVEQSREQEHDDIMQLRVLRVQEAVVKIMKMRKRLTNAQLQTELVEMLKHMFLPTRKMIKEQIEWLLEQKYLARDDNDINVFTYLA